MDGTYAGGKMLAQVADGIGTVTFNQPDKHNAMSVAMWDGLVAILASFAEQPDVRVVVMIGAGEKAFVSGADISEFDAKRADSDAQRDYDRLTSGGRAKLAAFPKPLIACIRGWCLGGGLGIAMQADLRIASSDSVFGIPAARLGIAYGAGMTEALISLVGPAHARMLLYSARRIDAAEATRIGLVNQTVPTESLETTVYDLARTIAQNAPLSIAAAKMITGQVMRGAARDLAAIDQAVAACFDSADYREGRRAFAEKRPARFEGR
jgi:enoyl-CoA hydratase